MPSIPDIFKVFESVISFVGSVFLGIGFNIFKGTKDEEENKNRKLNLLTEIQAERIQRLIENEISRFITTDSNDVNEIRKLEIIRKHGADNLLDDLWEEALTARKLQDNWIKWKRWENLGRKTCSIGFFVNVGVLLVILMFLITNNNYNNTLWLTISIILFLGPFLFAAFSWYLMSKYSDKVLSILNTPSIGAPRSRRFGDA